jgi:general secretion pathway protein D
MSTYATLIDFKHWPSSTRNIRLLLCLGALATCMLLTSCAGWQSFREGQEKLSKGDIEGGLERMAQAAKEAPENVRYRANLATQKEKSINELLILSQGQINAELFDVAELTYKRILAIEPNNAQGIGGLEQLVILRKHVAWRQITEEKMGKGDSVGATTQIEALLRENPTDKKALTLLRRLQAIAREKQIDSISPKLRAAYRKPVSLSLREATLVQIFDSLKLTAGINFMFDKDVKTDTRLTLSVTNKPLEDILKILLSGQRLLTQTLDEDTLLIYPNTPEKIRDYQELVIRTFFLSNADATKTLLLVRNLIRAKESYVDERLNAIVIRDTPEVVRMAEKVFANLDVAEPEVMLELEVLEVSVNKLRDFGIRFPESLGAIVKGAAGAGQLTLPEWQSRTSSLLNFSFSNPLVALNFKQSLGDSSLLANPRIRVKNRQIAKVLVGERVPVITTTTTANVGTAESVNYLDVGLKLELEPTISLDDDVSMKVALEVSNIVDIVTRASGLQAFRLGTRNASTFLRVKDGETQVLAGLIQLEDRRSIAGLPGVMDIPLINRLFSNTSSTDSRTEIVLLITPRVVRNLPSPTLDQLEIAAGTEASQNTARGQINPNFGGQPQFPFNPLQGQPTQPFQPTPVQPALPLNRPSTPSFTQPPLIPSSRQ